MLQSQGGGDLLIPVTLLAIAVGFAGLAIIFLYGKGKIR